VRKLIINSSNPQEQAETSSRLVAISSDLFLGAVLLKALTNKEPDKEMFDALYGLRLKTHDYLEDTLKNK